MWHHCKMKLCGTTTIGPKGQIVIPKEAREVLGLNPGDSVTLVLKDDKALAVIKNENIQELFDYIKAEWIKLES